MDLLKLVAPENANLQSLTLNQVQETLGDCIVNVYDYCGKCFSVFPRHESIYQCSTKGDGGNQCMRLRYSGGISNQTKRQRNLYFLTV